MFGRPPHFFRFPYVLGLRNPCFVTLLQNVAIRSKIDRLREFARGRRSVISFFVIVALAVAVLRVFVVRLSVSLFV